MTASIIKVSTGRNTENYQRMKHIQVQKTWWFKRQEMYKDSDHRPDVVEAN